MITLMPWILTRFIALRDFGMMTIGKLGGEKVIVKAFSSTQYWDMKKYEAWFDKHGKDYPVNWNIHFDEARHRDGSFYYFTRCPICEFCEREGIAELMPALCATDEVMFRLQHGKLFREHTISNGDGICDYWVVGDQMGGAK